MDYKRALVLHYTDGMSSRRIAEATGDGKTTVSGSFARKKHLSFSDRCFHTIYRLSLI